MTSKQAENFLQGFKGQNWIPNWCVEVHLLDDSDKAINDCTQKIGIDPNNAINYHVRGLIKYQSGDNYGAINDFKKAAECDPENAIYYDPESIRDKLRDIISCVGEEDAISFFDDLENPSNIASYYYNRGLLKSFLSLFDKDSFLKEGLSAVQDFNQAIEINPNKSHYYFHRGNTFTGENRDSDLEDMTKAIDLNPSNARYYFRRSDLRKELKDYKGVISDLTEAIKIDSGCENAYFYRALAKYELKDYFGTIEDVTKAIQINPGDDEFYSLRADGKKEIGHFKGAVEDLTKAIEINREEEYFYLRAKVKQLNGDENGAAEDWMQLYELNDGDENDACERWRDSFQSNIENGLENVIGFKNEIFAELLKRFC